MFANLQYDYCSMETHLQRQVDEEKNRFSSQFLVTSILGLGLGLGFGFSFRSPSQSLKPISTAVKVADGAIKGAKALQNLHSPSPLSLLLASKVLLKCYKATKRLNPNWTGPSTGFNFLSSKRFKACLGAANLARYATSPLSADGSFGFGVLNCGYKLSKNSAKVLEGFIGLQLDSAVRNGVDALGLVVKAAGVAREVGQWIARRGRNDCRFARTVGLRYEVCLRYKRSNFGTDSGCVRGFRVEFPVLEKARISGMSQLCTTELLCLAIPIH